MLLGPQPYEIVYFLGDMEVAERVLGPEAAERTAAALIARGHLAWIREPQGRVYTLSQFRARPPEPPPGPQPEEILIGARERSDEADRT
jgi:hypothetical protein